MKKLLLLFTVLSQVFVATADEGMWILSLLNKQEAQMQQMGLKLSADDIYNVNKSSLKDAIVWFNGGCTGEIVSEEGLLLTNHHCGYGVIAGLSTTDDNILDNGFYAKTKADEKRPKSPLFVSILQSIDDVTDAVLAELKDINSEADRAKKIRELTNKYVEEYGEGDKFLDVRLYEMFKGNQYFVFVYKKFTDVRLVGTPPQNVGKFGGDTDNWMWPRQTGDFSVFRIYADKNNNPADYSEDNVPYQPKHHLPVSTKGVNEGDFSMIVGFPGRTNRYEFAEAVKLSLDQTNMAIVDMRNIRLTEWKKIMQQDLATRLELSSKYASISNYWKYYIGQTEQLARLKVYEEKKAEEKAFQNWANISNEYKNILSEVDKTVTAYKPYAKHLYYIFEGVAQPELMQMARLLYSVNQAIESGDDEKIQSSKNNLQNTIQSRNWNPLLWEADQKIFAKIIYRYYLDIPADQQPEYFKKIAKKYKFDTKGEEGASKFTAALYKSSSLKTQESSMKLFNKLTAKTIQKEPAFVFLNTFLTMYNDEILPRYREYMTSLNSLGRSYLKGLMDVDKFPKIEHIEGEPATLLTEDAFAKIELAKAVQKQELYPDANSSIRLTYGKVTGYTPKDAVYYYPNSTINGVMEKYKPGDSEFDLTDRFIQLVKDKNYGKYADKNGELMTNFMTDNDITGGNSGSPMINGNGELTGLAFDGNWEAMSGDIYFDKKYKRTIAVDIRYVLWCIDILGEAPHIVNEMTLVD